MSPLLSQIDYNIGCHAERSEASRFWFGTGGRLRKKTYFVYILTNHSGTLYVGVTNDLLRRVDEHKKGLLPGFTRKYRLTRLIYYEETNEISTAICREKEIKGWLRKKKISLVESINPEWKDLSEGWY